MTKHKATPEEWGQVENWADRYSFSCLLELRARVEELEADRWLRQHARSVEFNYPAEPDSSLVEQVAKGVGSASPWMHSHRDEARAAIHAIANWLDQQELHVAATRLRMEVGQ